MNMEYIIGVVLGLGVGGLGTVMGLDRCRSFYPTILIVTASYYVLFGVMGASGRIVATEIVVATGFSLLALVGFKKSLWVVAAAIAARGVFDLVQHLFIPNPGVPQWWPGFCLAIDLVMAAWLAQRLIKWPLNPNPPKASALRMEDSNS